ncbi:BsuBI/PstI family type II restriction endonuclease [Dictyobacter arantiisoli]|uniref:BsuBI/PstI restriction endonuclease domain-containing protein n=1 Tax=Dictyobacter arantiisoli TaxID=2014874 RepID=A0A5A5T914_9CHLR|nr:BsuBI/PstI family type II restriction endonuclease [Dictyobacter arantiisoli]GCF07892.1 hypothetical protein KDI_14560 [Dictyobacter arantiisoli]
MLNHNSSGLKHNNGQYFNFALPGPYRHNSLLVDTIELFGPRYTPQASILHLQDNANMVSIHEAEQLQQFGMHSSIKHVLPDIILYQEKKQALFFIEVITKRGMVTPARKYELEECFSACSIRKIYITACYELQDYKHIIGQIAWGSYLWFAHTPDHIIFQW